MNVVQVVCGVLLLAAGRKLYWLFVAAVGFAFGLGLGVSALGETGGQEWAWVVGVIGGIIGAILALFFQKLTVALSGAAAGGYCGWVLMQFLGAETVSWVGLIIGALLGTILVLNLFDWGLIVFSSLAGALFIEQGIPMHGITSVIVFAAAVVVGIAWQGTHLARARARKPAEPAAPKQ
jgi:hypothetical protein